MTIPFLTTASSVMCPHGGTVSLSTSQSDVQAHGSAVLLESDEHSVAGCPFTTPEPKPSPCVKVRWQAGAQQCKVNGTGILTQASVGLCYAATETPQGPAVVAYTQSQAKGI